MATDGLTTIRSSHGPKDMMDRLETAVKAKGLTVFARIDHAAGAAEVERIQTPHRPGLEWPWQDCEGSPPACPADRGAGTATRLSAMLAFLYDFAGDLPAAKAKVLYAVQEPFHKALLTGRTAHARSKPSFYAVSTE
jgi:hypothetical protein